MVFVMAGNVNLLKAAIFLSEVGRYPKSQIATFYFEITPSVLPKEQ